MTKVQPLHWDVFLSHSQRDDRAVVLAEALFASLKEKGVSAWLDVKMQRRDIQAMEEGCRNCDMFVAIVTDGSAVKDNGYFAREFCRKELAWAMEAGVAVQPVLHVDDKKRISEFLGIARQYLDETDTSHLGKVDWVHLDRSAIDNWDAGIKVLLERLDVAKSTTKRPLRTSSGEKIPTDVELEVLMYLGELQLLDYVPRLADKGLKNMVQLASTDEKTLQECGFNAFDMNALLSRLKSGTHIGSMRRPAKSKEGDKALETVTDMQWSFFERDYSRQSPAVGFYTGTVDEKRRPSGTGTWTSTRLDGWRHYLCDFKYEGEWSEGKLEGRGKLSWLKDGTLCYTGDFRENFFDGHGTLYYKSGKLRYVGGFKKIRYHGNGYHGNGREYHESGGLAFEGMHDHDRRVGINKSYYENGQVEYDGEWNRKYHGRGKKYYEDGTLMYEGEWKEGARHGNGKAYWDNGNLAFEGPWVNGVARGTGTRYDRSGSVLHMHVSLLHDEPWQENKHREFIRQKYVLDILNDIKKENAEDRCKGFFLACCTCMCCMPCILVGYPTCLCYDILKMDCCSNE